MTPLMHEALEPEIEECVETFRRLAAEAPKRGRTTSLDTYLIEWGRFKRKVAEAAAQCIIRLVPSVAEVYYTELSEDYAGRDIDLVITVGGASLYEREIEDTIEAILAKLAEAAGIELHGHLASRLFEVHRSDSLIGSRSRVTLLARR